MSGRKLGRTSSHRKALFANLATELLRHEQIKTTLHKAKDLRSVVEPLITKACKGLGTDGELAARRQILRTVNDEEVVRKLFSDLAPKFKKRPGGYTRVVKAGFRKGDSAAMAIIELTEKSAGTAATKAKTTGKKAEAKETAAEKPTKETAKKEAAPKKEAKADTKTAAKKETTAKKPTAKKTEAKKEEKTEK
jgi:large subunit ribosomal protein L17